MAPFKVPPSLFASSPSPILSDPAKTWLSIDSTSSADCEWKIVLRSFQLDVSSHSSDDSYALD